MISILWLLIIIESAKKYNKNEFHDRRNPRQKLVCFAFSRDDVNNVNTVRKRKNIKAVHIRRPNEVRRPRSALSLKTRKKASDAKSSGGKGAKESEVTLGQLKAYLNKQRAARIFGGPNKTRSQVRVQRPVQRPKLDKNHQFAPLVNVAAMVFLCLLVSI